MWNLKINGNLHLEINCHLTGITDLVGNAVWCPEMQRITLVWSVWSKIKLYWQKPRQILETTMGSWVSAKSCHDLMKDNSLLFSSYLTSSSYKRKMEYSITLQSLQKSLLEFWIPEQNQNVVVKKPFINIIHNKNFLWNDHYHWNDLHLM